MSDHTPTPWEYCKTASDQMMIVGGENLSYVCSIQISQVGGGSISGAMELTRRANAAFIVKAVNSHDALVTELNLIADWRKVSLAGEYEHSLRDVIRSMLDCADRALASIKETV